MQRVLQLQNKIEEKVKASIEKRKDLYFFLLRMGLYLYISNCLIRIPKQGVVSDLEYYFSLFEAINYLVVLAIIFLLPTLSDFAKIKN